MSRDPRARGSQDHSQLRGLALHSGPEAWQVTAPWHGEVKAMEVLK